MSVNVTIREPERTANYYRVWITAQERVTVSAITRLVFANVSMIGKVPLARQSLAKTKTFAHPLRTVFAISPPVCAFVCLHSPALTVLNIPAQDTTTVAGTEGVMTKLANAFVTRITFLIHAVLETLHAPRGAQELVRATLTRACALASLVTLALTVLEFDACLMIAMETESAI